MVKTEEGRVSGVQAASGPIRGPCQESQVPLCSLKQLQVLSLPLQQGRALTTKSRVYYLLNTVLMPSALLGALRDVYIASQLILATALWDKTIIPFYCLGNRLSETK